MSVYPTPKNSGASLEACTIVGRILSFDGFAALRISEEEQPTGFISQIARAVDQELEELSKSEDGADSGIMEIEVVIDINDLDLSALDAVDAKNAIADAIEDNGIRSVTGSGYGLGMIDLDVDLAEDENAVDRLKGILDEFKVLERSSFRPLPEETE